MEVFETSEGVGAVRRGIPDSRWHLCGTVHFYVCKGVNMVSWLWIAGYIPVFLMGMFIVSCYAQDDINRLNAQIKRLQDEIKNKARSYQ